MYVYKIGGVDLSPPFFVLKRLRSQRHSSAPHAAL